MTAVIDMINQQLQSLWVSIPTVIIATIVAVKVGWFLGTGLGGVLSDAVIASERDNWYRK